MSVPPRSYETFESLQSSITSIHDMLPPVRGSLSLPYKVNGGNFGHWVIHGHAWTSHFFPGNLTQATKQHKLDSYLHSSPSFSAIRNCFALL